MTAYTFPTGGWNPGPQRFGDPATASIQGRFRQNAVGTNTGATATITHPGASGITLCVTGIEVSGDAACVVTIESPASTVLFTLRFAAAFVQTVTFWPGTMPGAPAADVLVKISASTTHCEANIQAVSIPQLVLDSPGLPG